MNIIRNWRIKLLENRLSCCKFRCKSHVRTASKENYAICNGLCNGHIENRSFGMTGKKKNSRRNIIAVVFVSWNQVHWLQAIRKETHPNHVQGGKFTTPHALNM